MAPKVPFQHPRYRLGRLIGRGGMGKVYLARDLLENRRVALKLYPSRFFHDRLRQEFLALRELHHPGVARACHFGVSEADGSPFFTLEYVSGKPLEAFLATVSRSPSFGGAWNSRWLRTGLHLFRQAAAALAYLHRRGVLHLDLKPENILVVERLPRYWPRPVLIDFGLVRAVHSVAAPLSHATLPFAAPEVFQEKAPTPASDVYSLAATFYRVFSGRDPVEGRDFQSFAEAHRSRTVAFPSGVPRPCSTTSPWPTTSVVALPRRSPRSAAPRRSRGSSEMLRTWSRFTPTSPRSSPREAALPRRKSCSRRSRVPRLCTSPSERTCTASTLEVSSSVCSEETPTMCGEALRSLRPRWGTRSSLGLRCCTVRRD